jgi:hypothetical protein
MNEGLSATGLDFTLPVAERGYRWWYLDALSDDGAHGITIIAFLGTVFSPWYAFARARDALPRSAIASPLSVGWRGAASLAADRAAFARGGCVRQSFIALVRLFIF